MTSLNMVEKAMIFKYILLTNQVVLVLEDAKEGNPLGELQCKILSKGTEILSRIIEGAVLVEGKVKDGFVPTMEGLSIYGYALSTLRKLDDLIKTDKGFTEFFETLYNDLNKLIEQKQKDNINITILEEFFHALGSSLRGDIQKETYLREQSLPIKNKKLMNEYIFA